jgi:hypothetical protein
MSKPNEGRQGGGDTTETISKYLVMTGTLFEVSGGNSNDNNRKKQEASEAGVRSALVKRRSCDRVVWRERGNKKISAR